MDDLNKNSKKKFSCYCGQPAARRAEFDRHLTSSHGVQLLKGALVLTYAEGDVEANPNVFRRVTADDVADMRDKDRKN